MYAKTLTISYTCTLSTKNNPLTEIFLVYSCLITCIFVHTSLRMSLVPPPPHLFSVVSQEAVDLAKVSL